MLAAHLSFSSLVGQTFSKGLVLATLAGAVALTGCTASKGGLGASLGESAAYEAQKSLGTKKQAPGTEKVNQLAKTAPEQGAKTVKKVALVDTATTSSVSKAKEKSSIFASTKTFRDGVKTSERALKGSALSARCRYLLAAAGSEATLLRSPTISGEVDHEGGFGANIGYDVLDLRRARLKERLARSQCRSHAATTKLNQLLVTSSLALSRAGFLAKADSLRDGKKELNAAKSRIRQGLNSGLLTVQRATILRQHLDRVAASEARARGEATRRAGVDAVQVRDVEGLDKELIEASREMTKIQRQLRKVEAYKVRLTGGYSSNAENDSIIDHSQDDLFAKVKVSIRLGTFNPKRDAYEDEIASAREDGMYEDQTGIFWRADEVARTSIRALQSLEAQRAQVAGAYAQAKRNSALRSTSLEPDLFMPRIRAMIDSVALRAELAGLDATIADTRRIHQKLSFGSSTGKP